MTANTARVRWVRQGVNGYGVGLVERGGSWQGDVYEAGDYVGIPASMVPGVDYIDRDRTTSAGAPQGGTNWLAIVSGALSLISVVAFLAARRKRKRR